jgi:hypothetical protein
LEAGCTPENIKGGFRPCGLWPFDIEWVAKHPEKFKLSEDLDALQERTLSTAFDAESCTHSTIAEKLEMLHQKILVNLEMQGIDVATHDSLVDLDKDLVKIYIPLSNSLARIYSEPAKALQSTGQKRRRTENAVGESHAEAKWLTLDNRRNTIRELGTAIKAQREQTNEQKLEKAAASLRKMAEKQETERKQQPILQVLVQLGYVEQEASILELQHLKAFYLKNKVPNDRFLGFSIGKCKQSKAIFLAVFSDNNLVESDITFLPCDGR